MPLSLGSLQAAPAFFQQRQCYMAMVPPHPARVWSPPLEIAQSAQAPQAANSGVLKAPKRVLALAPCVVPPAVAPQYDVAKKQNLHQAAPVDSGSRGAISQLQEFVQSSKEFPIPVKCQILQWAPYARRMVGASLQFRATVAFLLEGVPHHILGGWRSSKKLAQRDAAERALNFFITVWGGKSKHLMSPTHMHLMNTEHTHQTIGAPTDRQSAADESHDAKVLKAYCCDKLTTASGGNLDDCGDDGSSVPRWTLTPCGEKGERFEASVEFNLMSSPHMFGGPSCEDEASAVAATAKRVLWYLGVPGYTEMFEPNLNHLASQKDLPAPTEGWTQEPGDASLNDEEQAAQRKTEIMHVQNKLQQRFSKELEPGHSVWEWTYDTKQDDDATPMGDSVENEDAASLCRATVRIPLADKEFHSNWHPGQLDARLEACALVSKFLEGHVS